MIAACLTALVAATGATALALTEGPGPAGRVPPASETATAGAIEPGLLSSFGLLRRAQAPGDVIPASIPVLFSQASGANPALARHVSGEHGEDAWIIPGNGSTCILAQLLRYTIGGAVCTTSAGARVGQLDVQSASSLLPGAELVAGLVPDGVSAVSMHLADGSTITARVHEDVYLGLVQGAVTGISASDAHGALSIPAMSASSASPRLTAGG